MSYNIRGVDWEFSRWMRDHLESRRQYKVTGGTNWFHVDVTRTGYNNRRLY